MKRNLLLNFPKATKLFWTSVKQNEKPSNFMRISWKIKGSQKLIKPVNLLKFTAWHVRKMQPLLFLVKKL